MALVGFGDTAESDVLKLLFNNTAWANVGDAGGIQPSAAAGSFFPSLCTADPGENGTQSTNETSYTNYTRATVARSSAGWTVSGAAPTQVANTAAIAFPACGTTGATITHGVIGRAVSGAGEIITGGALTSPLAVASGITPSYAIGALFVTLE